MTLLSVFRKTGEIGFLTLKFVLMQHPVFIELGLIRPLLSTSLTGVPAEGNIWEDELFAEITSLCVTWGGTHPSCHPSAFIYAGCLYLSVEGFVFFFSHTAVISTHPIKEIKWISRQASIWCLRDFY